MSCRMRARGEQRRLRGGVGVQSAGGADLCLHLETSLSVALFHPTGKGGPPPPADNRWYRKIAIPLMNTDETKRISINTGKEE